MIARGRIRLGGKRLADGASGVVFSGGFAANKARRRKRRPAKGSRLCVCSAREEFKPSYPQAPNIKLQFESAKESREAYGCFAREEELDPWHVGAVYSE